MVVSRAPMRISFGGGGTDLEAYYARFEGFVLSTAINHYCYVAAAEPADSGIHIRSADYSVPEAYPAGSLPAARGPLALPKAAIALFAHDGLTERGVSLVLASDVPPGTGLGSSSAIAVALIHAIADYLDIHMDASRVADLACHLEIERLGMPIGKQDQYASAFGGLNTITFTTDGVDVHPLALAAEVSRELRSRLLLFSTGRRHDSGAILTKQRDDTRREPAVAARLHQIKALGLAMRDALLAGDLDAFGHLLDRAWREKRKLSKAISSASIDRWYAAARAAGALGGKITGAGGGGFLLLYAPPENVRAVRAAMEASGLRELPFDFDTTGARTLTRLPDEHRARLLGDGAHGCLHSSLGSGRSMPDLPHVSPFAVPPTKGG
jgi:D-glycero-alpha-D-manno-heptose-7-phosphate kinase